MGSSHHAHAQVHGSKGQGCAGRNGPLSPEGPAHHPGFHWALRAQPGDATALQRHTALLLSAQCTRARRLPT